jgi:hypothetical protein
MQITAKVDWAEVFRKKERGIPPKQGLSD